MKIKRIVGGNLESNCYIVYHQMGGACLVIDPGYDPKKISSFIEKEQLKPEGILLTHHHHDHVGAVEKLKNIYSVPVMIHRLDSFYYKDPIDRLLEDGDKIMLEDEEFTALHTPGHTHGGLCFISEKSKVVFTGDTIFDTDLGRTDLEDGSDQEMILSCKNVIDKWSNEYTIYPGHDTSATMKQVRKYNEEFLQCIQG